MEWWSSLLIFILLLLIALGSGMPVAFAFMLLNLLGIYIWGGGGQAVGVLVYSALTSLTSFTLVTIPLFVFMGEILAHTGMMREVLDALDKWIGQVPGRLGVLAVSGGTIFGALSGSGMAGVATLGSTLAPEMKRAGYAKEMSIGPILGSGGLALIIPPSIFAIVVGAVAEVSVASLIIACVVPGLMLSVLYAVYIIVRAKIQPDLAPPPAKKNFSFRERCEALIIVLPLGIIIFLVTGIIFFGVATPTEAAALGALGSVVMTGIAGRLSIRAFRDSMLNTVKITGMIFLIVAGSIAFSEFLAFTGGSRGLSALAIKLPLSPLLMIIAMNVVILILGCLIDEFSIVMITIPIFAPIVKAYGFDPIWFCVLVIINLIVGCSTPPFGLFLYVMKAITPEYNLGEIAIAGAPFFLIAVLLIAIIIAFPQIPLWLPGIMK